MKVEEADTYKRRPVPLNTVEAQKLISLQLKISPSKCMEAMEALYNKGLISYPRTETTTYNKTINLWNVVLRMAQLKEEEFGFEEYAAKLADKSLGLYGGPRDGGKDDKAHPPIHPVKLANKAFDFKTKQEELIYELLVKHFLASVSRDATGLETKVECQLADEVFTCNGLKILKRNFMEIYDAPWADKELPDYAVGDVIEGYKLTMPKGKTTPPKPLTEAGLITKMDEHGIGTDATIHEHIKNIQIRGYTRKQGTSVLPTELGTSLVETYKDIGLNIYKPELRAQMESDMKDIADGTKKKEDVLADSIKNMRELYGQILTNKK